MRKRWRHSGSPAEWPADEHSEGVGLVETVDAALTSLRGRRSLRGSAVAAMFELLGDALPDPAAAPTSNILVLRSLEAFREASVVPTAVVADRLLDLRIAARAEAGSAGDGSHGPDSVFVMP